MAATNNLLGYETTSQVTITLASLTSGTTQESASVSNTSRKDFDYLATLTFTIASGTPSTSGPAVNLYAIGTLDGTLWPAVQLSSGAAKAASGTDNQIGALGSPPNVRLIGSFGLQTTTSSAERTFTTEPFSVAAAFGGVVPQAFSLFVENQTGVAFSSSTTTSKAVLMIDGVFTSSGN